LIYFENDTSFGVMIDAMSRTITTAPRSRRLSLAVDEGDDRRTGSRSVVGAGTAVPFAGPQARKPLFLSRRAHNDRDPLELIRAMREEQRVPELLGRAALKAFARNSAADLTPSRMLKWESRVF
jgi:hypothetical protein